MCSFRRRQDKLSGMRGERKRKKNKMCRVESYPWSVRSRRVINLETTVNKKKADNSFFRDKRARRQERRQCQC